MAKADHKRTHAELDAPGMAMAVFNSPIRTVFYRVAVEILNNNVRLYRDY